MNLQALKDRVIIRPDDAPTETESGIALAHGKRYVPETGRVVSAGPGSGLLSGDIVVFDPGQAHPLTVESAKYVTMRAEHVHAVLEA